MNGPRHADAITDRVRSMLTTERRVVEFHADGKLTKLGFFIDSRHVLTRASGPHGEGKGFIGGKVRTSIDLTVVATNDALDLMLLKTEAPTKHTAIDWLDEVPLTGTLLAAPFTGATYWTVGIVSVSLRTPESVDPSKDFLGRSAFYDSINPADAVFPAYFDTDLHLYVHETGQPVFDVNGLCVGIAIRSSFIGARVIPANFIQTWVESLKLDAAE
jgi:S1-C subfamily serine protease